ncbi:MAG: cysteine-rich CWC family protein [Rhodocyclales bacterium]|nr:cysteine-rich CWC family protein [Rhodocyclales bacterium]
MSAAPAPVSTNVCPQCGAQFRCGMEGGDKACWCASLPALLPLPLKAGPGSNESVSCLCPACLKERLAAPGKPSE